MILLTFIFFATSALGQGMRPGKWWKDPTVTQQLQLTNSQISQLDAAYNNSRRKMIKLKSDVERERFELQNIFEKKNLDEKAIKKQHRKVEKVKDELSEERLEFIMEVRKIIGSEKYGQLKLIFSDSFSDRYRNQRHRDEPNP